MITMFIVHIAYVNPMSLLILHEIIRFISEYRPQFISSK